MSVSGSGPIERSPKEPAKTKALADLRQATWEAVQFCTYWEIEDFVTDVLDEIGTDEP